MELVEPLQMYVVFSTSLHATLCISAMLQNLFAIQINKLNSPTFPQTKEGGERIGR